MCITPLRHRTFLWRPRLCLYCGSPLWLSTRWLVESGPNTTDAYCGPECGIPGETSRQRSWVLEIVK